MCVVIKSVWKNMMVFLYNVGNVGVKLLRLFVDKFLSLIVYCFRMILVFCVCGCWFLNLLLFVFEGFRVFKIFYFFLLLLMSIRFWLLFKLEVLMYVLMIRGGGGFLNELDVLYIWSLCWKLLVLLVFIENWLLLVGVYYM